MSVEVRFIRYNWNVDFLNVIKHEEIISEFDFKNSISIFQSDNMHRD